MTEEQFLAEYRNLPPDLQAELRKYARELLERRADA